MPDNLTLELAKAYGVAPHTVEDWPACWYNRAAMKLNAESVAERNRFEKARKKK